MKIRLYAKMPILIIALSSLIHMQALSMEEGEVEVTPTAEKSTKLNNDMRIKTGIVTKEDVDKLLGGLLKDAQECNKVFDFGQTEFARFIYIDNSTILPDEFLEYHSVNKIIGQHSRLYNCKGSLSQILSRYAKYRHLSYQQIIELEDLFKSTCLNLTQMKKQIKSAMKKLEESSNSTIPNFKKMRSSLRADKESITEYKKAISEIDAFFFSTENFSLLNKIFGDIQTDLIEYGYHPAKLHISEEWELFMLRKSLNR
jgi:hypothetical protein